MAYPTCGEHTEHIKQWDEVIAIKQTISHILDEKQRNVVLAMHSYGGWPGSRAVKGLDMEKRKKLGKTTGIVQLVFIAAFLLPDNAPMEIYSYLPPWLTVKVDFLLILSWLSLYTNALQEGRRIPNEASVPLLFSDLQPAAQKHWLSKFAWHRNDFTAKTVPDAPWHLSIPKTYIITTGDKAATPEFQFKMLMGVMDETWTIKSISSGHEPFLSQPKVLAEVLLQPGLG